MQPVEPEIIINGQKLDDAEAMVVRMGIEELARNLNDPDSLGDDEHGKTMVTLYKNSINRVRRKIFDRKD